MTQIQTSKALSLSSEIISEIFKNFSTPVVIGRRPKPFPWFLGQICSQWRNVFISMSTHFWGNIEIDVSRAREPFPFSVASFKHDLDMLNFYLKRNEGCPLSFSFRMGSHYAEEYVCVIDILDALLAQSMRWLKAELWIPFAEQERLYHIKGRMPLLQSLVFAQQQLEGWEEFAVPDDPGFARFADAFEDTPSLTHLQLYSSNLKGWKCDWSSIVVLRFKSLSTADGLVAALSQSTHLEELEVNFYAESGAESEPINTARSAITLSSLKKLTLSEDVLDVLGVLTTPGLKHLSVKFRNSDGRAGVVTAFLRRSSCPLGHLVLDSASPAVAVEVLSVIPGLPSLEINGNVDGIFKLFNCHLPEGTLLIGPRLKSLQVRAMNLKQRDIVELSTMVASRAQNVEVDGLQELTLWVDYTWSRVDPTILQSQCEEQNVKLTVGGGVGEHWRR